MERIASLSQATLSVRPQASPRKIWRLFLIVAAIHVAAGLLYQDIVMTDSVVRELVAGRVDPDRIDEALSTLRQVSLAGHLLQPVVLGVRVAIVALLLQFGFLLLWIELPFQKVFRIALVASLTGAAMLCAKAWIHATDPPLVVSASMLMVPPLSLASLVGIDSYSPAARVVLQNANLFELFWIILVWNGVRRVEPIPWSDAAFIVLAVWCATVLVQAGAALVFSGGLL